MGPRDASLQAYGRRDLLGRSIAPAAKHMAYSLSAVLPEKGTQQEIKLEEKVSLVQRYLYQNRSITSKFREYGSSNISFSWPGVWRPGVYTDSYNILHIEHLSQRPAMRTIVPFIPHIRDSR